MKNLEPQLFFPAQSKLLLQGTKRLSCINFIQQGLIQQGLVKCLLQARYHLRHQGHNGEQGGGSLLLWDF